jgi:hypothetical protein
LVELAPPFFLDSDKDVLSAQALSLQAHILSRHSPMGLPTSVIFLAAAGVDWRDAATSAAAIAKAIDMRMMSFSC